MSLKGRLSLSNSLTNTKSSDLSTPVETLNQSVTKNISTGTLYSKTYSLSSSEVLEIDVADGSLTDTYGDSVGFLEFDFHFQQEGTGSQTEDAK